MSGSHFKLGKQQARLDIIKLAALRNGGIHMYANCRGCDGNRLYFDANSLISMNGVPLVTSD